jgi:nucleotide-binding universal stress UspA family protein
MMTLGDILVATDFSEPATAAYCYGKDFARAHGATLHVLHVVGDLNNIAISDSGVDLNPVQRQIEEDAATQLTELTRADASGLHIRTAVLVSSVPARTILSYARDEHIDLIVIGTQGRTGLARLFLGSVAQHMVQSAPCPVLTVHHPERDFVHPDALQVIDRSIPVTGA